MQADVLVVGAGASGIPAAVGAARAGVRVLLIEEDPVIGGAVSDFYVDMFCGHPRCGVVAEAEAALKAHHRLGPRGDFFLPVSFQRVYGAMLAAAGVRGVCGARAVGVIHEAGRVAGVRIEGADGQTGEVRAAVTIDATGSGAVSAMAGCEVLYGTDAKADFHEPHAADVRSGAVQQCTWMYLSHRMTERPFDMMKLENVRRGVLVDGMGWFHNAPDEAMKRNPAVCLHWGCAVECRDTRDPLALAAAQADALNAMERDHALLREAGYAVHLAPRIGVRECRRIVGEHVITENDLRSGKLPADTIAVGTYHLDIWGKDLSREECTTPKYGIPYRALVPKGVDGLLLAGKALSGSHVAMSAYRVMPIVGSAGQSAGVAAALAAGAGISPREVDVARVRRIAADQGVLLT